MAKSKPKAKKKYRVGSIIAVPLPEGRFAFAKVFKDFDLGVYDYVADEVAPLTEVLTHKIAFFQAAGDAPIKSGEWPVIGEQLFPDEESAWGPPRASGVIPGYKIDPMMLRIRHKDVARRATLEEAAGMDVETFSQRPELLVEILVDRLINGNHDKYRIPQ